MATTGTQKPETDELLDKNPLVDKTLVANHTMLEAELERLGVNTKPRFGITHPLGEGRLLMFNERVHHRRGDG